MRYMLDTTKDYKPGDLPPEEGYLEWHAWAEVQRKAGIKQVPCPDCGLWCTPQELSTVQATMRGRLVNRKLGIIETVGISGPVCLKCAEKRRGRDNKPAR